MEEYNGHLNIYTGGCSKCNSPEYEPGYKVRFCKACRKKLTRYPVKKEVIWAAIGVGVILLISLFRLPGYFVAGVDYMRAVRLTEERKYVSAQKAFEVTLKKFPEHPGSIMHLITAAYFNDDLEKMDSLFNLLDEDKLSSLDSDLEAQFDLLNEYSSHYRIRNRKVYAELDRIANDTAAYQNKLEGYVKMDSDDLAAKIMLANLYEIQENHMGADSLAGLAIHAAPLFRPAYYIRLAALKDLKRYGEGLKCAETLLTQNKESLRALLCQCFFQLKLNMLKEGLATSKLAAQLYPDDNSALFWLSVSYHLNHQQAESERIFAKLQARPDTDTSKLTELQNYITDKVPFRD
ncbi:tetratricopeptide repeat protein [Chitinophaga agri]|uniref:Tetratricopeptide repeat protein n=1 Tax=Chitinophaga agri TaxID=2703787 RepID=A0A6B9ZJJ0_9BACT|nr:hypothetical protein [Chitinophaga agri]QHS61534.1 hypothetical protein GWR21_18615 [Chitinophaga agri]